MLEDDVEDTSLVCRNGPSGIYNAFTWNAERNETYQSFIPLSPLL